MSNFSLFLVSHPQTICLASRLHEEWIFRQASRGYHSPYQCPCRTEAGTRETRSCSRCDPGLYPFDELPEDRRAQYLDILEWVYVQVRES